MRICGQWFSTETVNRIQALVEQDPSVSRRALSHKVCEWLDWKSASGDWQSGGARRALARLHRMGAIELPPVTRTVAPRQAVRLELEPACIEADLPDLGQIELILVHTRKQAQVYRGLIAHHPLGDKPLCGASLRYLIRCEPGYLGAGAFQSASFALAARDAAIGWSETARRANLRRVIANARFLVLPAVKVPNLASHLLGRLIKRVADDWQTRYGVRPVLIETFVQPDHEGTCYKAANWIEAGQSAGRRDGIRKRLLLYPLCPDWRARLRHTEAAPPSHRPERCASWAEEEFGAIRLWDARLKRRLYHLAERFHDRASGALTERGRSWAETIATYRFLKNPRVNMQLMLAAHREAVIARCAKHPVVLAPQDTTYLNYSAHPATAGPGPIGTRAQGPIGLVLHNTHAFTPDGLPLGVLDADCRARDPDMHAKRRADEDKESLKWIDAWRRLSDLQRRCPDTMLVSVCDREGDFYALLRVAQDPQGARLLVRAERSRHRKVEGQAGELAPLWEVMGALPCAGHMGLALPRQGAHAGRQVALEVRFAPVAIHPPKPIKGQPVAVWAVHLLERQPPEGIDAIEWMLLTTVPTTRFEEAITRAQWYAARWGIEVFHRTLKSGCRIEDRQPGSASRLETRLAIDMVVAWRINYMTWLARTAPDAPCTVFFEGGGMEGALQLPPQDGPFARHAADDARGHSLGGADGRLPGTQKRWPSRRDDDLAGLAAPRGGCGHVPGLQRRDTTCRLDGVPS